MAKPIPSTDAFEAARVQAESERYVLRLYVAGTTPGSTRAVEALRELCDEHLAGRYDLEIIDVYQQPTLARNAQIIAVPTLVKKLPAPLRKILGDLADKQRVLIGLDLQPKPARPKPARPKPARPKPARPKPARQKPARPKPAQQKPDEKKRRTPKRP